MVPLAIPPLVSPIDCRQPVNGFSPGNGGKALKIFTPPKVAGQYIPSGSLPPPPHADDPSTARQTPHAPRAFPIRGHGTPQPVHGRRVIFPPRGQEIRL